MSDDTQYLNKAFNPAEIDAKWSRHWEDAGYGRPSGNGQAYCIMIPPPNVTGRLHMGHGFQHTLMDILIRYHRMNGDQTLWQVGTDHAGIATQMVVERNLLAAGQHRLEIGRDAFVDKIWEWKALSGGTITQQMRAMGISVDWDRETFTLDEGYAHAVTTAFVKLYEDGLIYRGQRLVNWDPVLKTAISDLEVIMEPRKDQLYHLRYPVVGSDEVVIVATTRPETLFGDTAVAVHPADARYAHLIGQSLQLPLTNRKIPVVDDDYVDPDFGSGCVKITPAHDFNDYAVGARHDLPLINVLTPDAKLNNQTPEAYQGMDCASARKAIIAALEALDLIEAIEAHDHKVPIGDRSGVVIEPYLTDQWFVDAKKLAEPALNAVKNGDAKFVPAQWENTYFRWLEDIQDWCISRQLWWGHRIPAWYDEDGKLYVGMDEADARKRAKLRPDVTLTQDDDVLDTWFSSALWPFATLGWPDQTPDLSTFFPTNVLVTGFDLIFFWIARMVMMSLHFTGQVPFKDIYITGLIRDHAGQKMSKSKGNVLDPIDLIQGITLDELIDKRTQSLMQPEMKTGVENQTRKAYPNGIVAHGTDPLRFTFTAMAGPNRELRFDMSRLEGYRNFCNKLWNACRFVLMQLDGYTVQPEDHALPGSLADRWIISNLQEHITKARSAIESYRFDLYASSTYEFTWNQACDWYIELSKPALSEGDTPRARKSRATLLSVFTQILRLLHPTIPFITEELWTAIGPLTGANTKSLMLETYPIANPALLDPEACKSMEWLQTLISAVRSMRSELGISPAKTLKLLAVGGTPEDLTSLNQHRQALHELAKIESVTIQKQVPTEACATTRASELALYLPLNGLIDLEAERTRLDKQLTKLNKQIDTAKARLDNPHYRQNAPEDVVQKTIQEVEAWSNTLAQLTAQRKQLG